MRRHKLKALIMECLKESIKKQPLIVSARPPNDKDIYEEGTVWVNGKKKYYLIELKAKWKEIKEKK